MKQCVFLLLAFATFTMNAQDEPLRYLEDGTPILSAEETPPAIDSLAGVAKAIAQLERKRASYVLRIDEIDKDLRTLKREGNRLGGLQEKLDVTHWREIQGLETFGEKSIKVEFNQNTDRARIMEITGYTERYEEREDSILPDPSNPDSLITVTVTDTIPDPILVNIGRVRMKGPNSFEYENAVYYRVQKRNRIRWYKEDDKKVYFE